jgi:flagellar assembly factor FliW
VADKANAVLPVASNSRDGSAASDKEGRAAAVQISTTRFGLVTIEPGDILHFPGGLLGLEDCHRWVLLADGENEALAWLQSTSRPEVALAVVHPKRFVPQYQLRVGRRDLEPLALSSLADAEVLAIVSSHHDMLTLNLKAPLVINLPRRLGRQVITESDATVHHAVAQQTVAEHALAHPGVVQRTLNPPTLIPSTTSLKRVA